MPDSQIKFIIFFILCHKSALYTISLTFVVFLRIFFLIFHMHTGHPRETLLIAHAVVFLMHITFCDFQKEKSVQITILTACSILFIYNIYKIIMQIHI